MCGIHLLVSRFAAMTGNCIQNQCYSTNEYTVVPRTRPDPIVFGIDLGTSKACAAIMRNGKVSIVKNEYDERLTPCYVEFANDKCNIGNSAQKNAPKHPKNTVYGIKKLMGVSSPEENCHFFVVHDRSGRPQIRVEPHQTEFYPEEIESMIIEKLKTRAENLHATTFKQAVIAVPAQFNNAQRLATQTAGRLAGFEKICLINESTAVALAYNKCRPNKVEEGILVFDLGAGYFDVSVCKVTNDCVTVLASDGRSFGGDSFDDFILKNMEHRNIGNIDEKAHRRLRSDCEKAKIMLSDSATAGIRFDDGDNGEIDYELTQKKFEKWNNHFFDEIERTINDILSKVAKDSHEIDQVILVGGSYRIGKVHDMLRTKFGSKLNETLDSFEAVAIGAAIYADLVRQGNKKRTHGKITDVISRSLSFVSENGKKAIVKMNTAIPFDKIIPLKQENFANPESTSESENDNPAEFSQKADEDVTNEEKIRKHPNQNKLALKNKNQTLPDIIEKDRNGERVICSIPESRANISLKVDCSGIIHVKVSGKDISVGGPTEEIDKMISHKTKIAKKYDEMEKTRLAKNDYEKYIYKQKDKINTLLKEDAILKNKTHTVLRLCDDELKWVEDKRTQNATTKTYVDRKKKMEPEFDDEFWKIRTAKERMRREARHTLQSLIFEITKKCSEDTDLYRRCIELEDSIEFRDIKARKDFEYHRRELETEAAKTLQNETAETGNSDDAKNAKERNDGSEFSNQSQQQRHKNVQTGSNLRNTRQKNRSTEASMVENEESKPTIQF